MFKRRFGFLWIRRKAVAFTGAIRDCSFGAEGAANSNSSSNVGIVAASRCVSPQAQEQKQKTVRVGVPSKGRLFEQTLSLIRAAGFEFSSEGVERKLSLRCSNFPLELFFVRSDDIPCFVESGAFDFGITGFDLVCEKAPAGVVEELDLGFAGCRLALAAPRSCGIACAEDLEGKRVATSFPFVARGFFASRGIRVEVLELRGAVENACRLNAADAIVDLVASGATLEANGLAVVEGILDSTARLVRSEKKDFLESSLQAEFVDALKSVVEGRRRKFVVANAPERALPAIREVIPALCSPTVSRLLDGDMVALQVVVDERELSPLVRKLKACGASGIVVSSVERLVF